MQKQTTMVELVAQRLEQDSKRRAARIVRTVINRQYEQRGFSPRSILTREARIIDNNQIAMLIWSWIHTFSLSGTDSANILAEAALLLPTHKTTI